MPNALDLVIRRRNATNTGYENVAVPVSPLQSLKTDVNEAPYFTGTPTPTPTTINTAGAGTFTAAAIATGGILRDCAGGARTDTTDTAANIIAAIPQLATPYSEFSFFVSNISAGNYASTLAAGTGVTMVGTPAVPQNGAVKFVLFSTSATTLSIRQV